MSNRLLLAALLWIGSLSGSVASGTQARFTTVVDSTANQFSAGTLRIGAGVTAGTLSIANLVPGDTFDAQLQISNPGTLALAYAMTTSIAGSTSLAQNYLTLTIRNPSSDCSTAGGTDLYGSGPLLSAHIGDPSHGLQIGDRQLAAGTTELLCFKVLLSPSTPEALQNTNVTATFTFAAEQF